MLISKHGVAAGGCASAVVRHQGSACRQAGETTGRARQDARERAARSPAPTLASALCAMLAAMAIR
jgi:hypothetical protein